MKTINEQVYRYGAPLPHQSLATRRDLHAERTINQNLGKVSVGYVLTDEQVDQRRTGRGPSTGLPYRYLVYSPGNYATSWTAFYTLDELTTFADAYGLTVSGDLEPGGHFEVAMPAEPVRSFAVVATDREAILSDVFATVEEAAAEMHRLYPHDWSTWDGREVPVAVADLATYWRTIRETLSERVEVSR